MKVPNKVILFLLIATLAPIHGVARAQGLSDPPGPRNTQTTRGDSARLSPKANIRNGLTHEVGPPSTLTDRPRIDPRANADLLKKANTQVVSAVEKNKNGDPLFRSAARKVD